jgi:predicted DNA-binding protein
MKFQREERPTPRSKMLSIRMTEEQIATLDGVATALGIEGGKAALIRTAIDYYMEHDRAARLAAQRLNRRTEK